MSVSKQEREHDAHMGPGESYPAGPAGQHLRDAWDLAGHASDPDQVRRNILNFAREHGLTSHLPQAAKDYASGAAKKALLLITLLSKKAKGEDLGSMYNLAWQNSSADVRPGEAWSHLHHAIVRHARETGNMRHLPDDAHAMMHHEGIRHEHDGVEQEGEGEPGSYNGAGHSHAVSKAFAQPAACVSKAWAADDGSLYIEGWISTEDRDLEKDIVLPEAFTGAMDDYFHVGAPVSSEHNTNNLPVGHLQKAAVVRNGEVLKSATHPTDSAEFEHFTATGTGLWGRARITEATTGDAIKKGNVRGFSWIGFPAKAPKLPGGGRRFEEIQPWNETTVAAYPINQRAAIVAATTHRS